MKKKRIDCKAKGRRREKEAKALLEQDGWLVEITKMGSRFEKNKDFFHLFDLIAIKKSYGRTLTRWIQVKSTSCPKKVREEISQFSKKYFDARNQAEVWIKKDFKPWKRIVL